MIASLIDRYLPFAGVKRLQIVPNYLIVHLNYVAARSNDGHRDEFYGKVSLDSRVMGGDLFVESVFAQTEGLQLCKPTLEQVLAAVMKIYTINEEELFSKGQRRQPSEARSMAAWAVLELTDATLTELAIRMKRDAGNITAGI
jgi:hypothetical protein